MCLCCMDSSPKKFVGRWENDEGSAQMFISPIRCVRYLKFVSLSPNYILMNFSYKLSIYNFFSHPLVFIIGMHQLVLTIRDSGVLLCAVLFRAYTMKAILTKRQLLFEARYWPNSQLEYVEPWNYLFSKDSWFFNFIFF